MSRSRSKHTLTVCTVPPQPANVTAQVQQQDDKCGIMLSWQSAIPTAVSSSQLHYIVTWFAHSLDTDGSEADVHSVTLTQVSE